MKSILILPLTVLCFNLNAQKTIAIGNANGPTKEIKESIALGDANELDIDFPYASDIRLNNSTDSEIEIYVQANINDGQDNEVYQLEIETIGDRIRIASDQKRLDDFFKQNHGKSRSYCYRNEIIVEIAIPRSMFVNVESISASVTGELRGKRYSITTISGDIDLTVPEKVGAEVIASTISGAMYSDVDLDHLDGKEGLRQVVGEKIHVRINKGGETHRLETISGDVMLRAGE